MKYALCLLALVSASSFASDVSTQLKKAVETTRGQVCDIKEVDTNSYNLNCTHPAYYAVYDITVNGSKISGTGSVYSRGFNSSEGTCSVEGTISKGSVTLGIYCETTQN